MSDSDLAIHFVTQAAGIPASLWDGCFPPNLEGRWWYETLETSGLDGQFEFFYGVICQNGEAVGIAPCFVMDVPIELVLPDGLLPLFRVVGTVFPTMLAQRTLFVGSPCADEGTVGLLPGVPRRPALLALQRALDEKQREVNAPMLVWKDFPASAATDLAWLAGRNGLFPMASFPGTQVALPSSSKEDYFATLKGSRRHQLKKKLRRSAQAADLDVQVCQCPDGAAMDEIFGLFWQTYEKSETKFERLNRAFFDRLATMPPCHFVTLRERASGRMVAFMLCFDGGERMINKFIGIDYQRPREWMLYFRLWEAALDWALSRGFSAIQSGQTGYAPKIEMGHDLVPLTNYCRHRNPLVHRIYATVARKIGWHTLDDDLAKYLKAHPEAALTG